MATPSMLKGVPSAFLKTKNSKLPELRSYQKAHGCYKEQSGWQQVLRRFPRGGGMLYDLEFLTDEKGRRVAAFGASAGYCGAALACLTWAHQALNQEEALPSVSSFPDKASLIKTIKAQVDEALPRARRPPKVLVIGALGRCGNGAVQLCKDVGIKDEDVVKWDMVSHFSIFFLQPLAIIHNPLSLFDNPSRALFSHHLVTILPYSPPSQAETAPGGPFPEIVESDIFINCVYLGNAPIPPFVTIPQLQAAGHDRHLTVVCDVSCDPTSPNNPVRIYETWTSFSKPTVAVKLDDANGTVDVEGKGEMNGEGEGGRRPLDVIAIDHLPSLLPREASEDFCKDLLPHLLTLERRKEVDVWTGAEKLFKEKVESLPEEKIS
ncbi:MAG: hypothetical protein Q9183_003601 [Haloplaca sp. 2 TL-2023]